MKTLSACYLTKPYLDLFETCYKVGTLTVHICISVVKWVKYQTKKKLCKLIIPLENRLKLKEWKIRGKVGHVECSE